MRDPIRGSDARMGSSGLLGSAGLTLVIRDLGDGTVLAWKRHGVGG